MQYLSNSRVLAHVAVLLSCFACSSGETEIVTRIPLSEAQPASGGTGTSGGETGSGGSGTTSGGGGAVPSGGNDSGATAGTGATGGDTGATGGTDGGGTSGTGGSGGTGPTLTGHFSMLVFSKTAGFRHDSIAAGLTMLTTLAAANDFEVVASEDAAIFNDEDLDQFQIVFFLNTTDDILDAGQQTAMENFIKKGRGFAGCHAAGDTEDGFGWAWYEDLLGSTYTTHGAANTPGTLEVEPGSGNHPAVKDLPTSWNRNDEWYLFKRDVSALPGVQVLLRFSEDDRPMSWTREWDGGRTFYTAGGHDSAAFAEDLFQKHVLGGVLWAARRFE
jgi:type 1 glutamine amidotransferase